MPAKVTARQVRALGVGEKIFCVNCAAYGLPEPKFEVEWAKSIGRKWRFDYLFNGWLAVEKMGGSFIRGRHSRGIDQIKDMERRNEAQIMAYVVLEFPPKAFDDGTAFEVIKRALESRPDDWGIEIKEV